MLSFRWRPICCSGLEWNNLNLVHVGAKVQIIYRELSNLSENLEKFVLTY